MNRAQQIMASPLAVDATSDIGLTVEALSLSLQGQAILTDINMSLNSCGVTSLIGPSGAGKSSLLRCINGLNENWQGQIQIASKNIDEWPGGWDALRQHVGLIAQSPSVFPVSIYDNVVFGLPRRQRRGADDWVEQCLRQAALWQEVKERLNAPAKSLSLGQQQRLCIARALAIKPGVLLLDEPCASLDPRSKQLVEQTMTELAQQMPLLCVTHDLEQVRRLGGQVVFICDGRVVEQASASDFFAAPQRLESREFLRWSVCDCD